MKLVLLSGKAGSGKTTMQIHLYQHLGNNGKKVKVANFGDLVKYVCRNFFDWDMQKNHEGRALLQRVGTDIIKADDQHYWIRFIADMIKYCGNEYDYMVVGDCRFPDEIEYFKQNNIPNLDEVIAVRINRNKMVNIDEENAQHISETALDNYDGFDLVVTNEEEKAFGVGCKIAEFLLEGK